MNKDMVKGVALAVITLALAFGGTVAFKHFSKKPIDVVKEAYEEYGYNYAFKIVKENLDPDNAEEWNDAIDYLGEAEFGYLWDKVKNGEE